MIWAAAVPSPFDPSPHPAGDPRPTKTARFLSLVTERHGSLASIPLDRVAGMTKYAIALAIVLIVAAFATRAVLPARYLPGNRARHLRTYGQPNARQPEYV